MKTDRVSKIIFICLIILFSIFIKGKEVEAYTAHTLQEAYDWATSKALSNWWQDVDGQNGCQCVDLIYAYYDYLVGYHPGGNAAAFASNALPSGWTRVNNPTPGDIVVWGPGAKYGWDNPYIGSDGDYGHIGIVYAVTDYASIWTVETNAQPGRSKEVIYTYGGAADDYERNPSQVACYIHPDFKTSISSNALNLGDNFYAYLMMSSDWQLFNVDSNSKVVLQKGVWQDAKQVWNFVRQSDGSYTIKNVVTGKFLDVCNSNDYDGGGIQTFSYNGSNAQKYFIYGEQSKAVLRPACSKTRVVSVDGGKNLVGMKLNMWEYWGVETQHFYIWKLDEAKASTLSYTQNNNSSSNNITIKWTAGKNVDKYNIIISSNKNGKLQEIKKINNIATNSYSFNLAAGYYEIKVEGWNWFSNAFSNTIKFTINEHSKFSDVKQSDWFFKAVQWCSNRAIVSGYGNGKFGPNDKITRSQVIAMLWNGSGKSKSTIKLSFKDVPSDAYYIDALKWAVDKKIVSGYSSSEFGPNDPITREQLATILSNLAKANGKKNTSTYNLSAYSDNKNISSYASSHMKYIVEKKIINGVEIKDKNGKVIERKLLPRQTATRAEAVTMIKSYFNNIMNIK